jgi:hypothetical protein
VRKLDREEAIYEMTKFVNQKLHPYKFDKTRFDVEFVYSEIELEYGEELNNDPERIYKRFRVLARKGHYKREPPEHRRRRKNMLNGL